jgi:hypothetical protein
MRSTLPVNATSQDHAERIAADAFRRMAPEGVRLERLSFLGDEPLRPFRLVGASEKGATRCYLFAVEWGRA